VVPITVGVCATCAGLCSSGVGLLQAQVFPHHLLQRAHEHGDEPVDVARVVAARRLQDHQRSWRRERPHGAVTPDAWTTPKK